MQINKNAIFFEISTLWVTHDLINIGYLMEMSNLQLSTVTLLFIVKVKLGDFEYRCLVKDE